MESGGPGVERGKITVLKVHLDRRPIGRFAHPDIKIFAFSGFEKQHIIAVVQFSQLVQLIQLGFGVEFCIFATMREKGIDIIQKMSVTAQKNMF